ncbi:hypothetical protein BJI67_10800 [Acidihalobacter aeolianus]|uniref:Uncharacterized protein n=1 Tax=Acidihalobacter aeolianus TaxID=2792603 RepID=A0A1D8K939_9GAMM|nr:hypothetical protein BJI67_10800 [Acidihalobacter aeolianus]
MESPVSLYPAEPPVGGWGDLDVFDEFLRWSVSHGASDIKITPTDPISLSISGAWWAVTRRALKSFIRHEFRLCRTQQTLSHEVKSRYDCQKGKTRF